MNTVKFKNERQRKHFSEWIDQKIAETRAKIRKGHEELEDLEGLKNQVLDEDNNKTMRRTKLSWRGLCRRAVEEAGTFITTNDIYDKVPDLDSSKANGTRKKVIQGISAALSGLSRKGEFVNFEHPNIQGYLWGREEWVDERGVPKRKYREKLRDRGIDLTDMSFFNEKKGGQ